MRVIAGNNRARSVALPILMTCLVLGLVLFAATEGSAQLKILRVNKGGSVPTNAVGGGNLTAVFNAACDWWESRIKDTHTVTIDYSWAPLGGSTLGVHNLVTQSGTPNRETKATIRFDNDGSSVFFIDPTPYDHSEYNTYSQTTQDFGGGTMNKGRVYSSPTGSAVGKSDLLAVAIHEVGHALGLSSANTAFSAENGDGDIDVTSPRPYPGSDINTISGAHLNVGTALMFPSISSSIRRVGSDVDTVSNAQISKFTSINLGSDVTCINAYKYLPDSTFSNNGNSWPFSANFAAVEGRYQWFIHRSKLGCKGLIKSIDVRPLTSFTLKATACEIRISHTSQSAPSSNFATNLPKPVVVRPAGPIDFTGTATTWSSIGLTKGFLYDGVSNLTIEIRLKGVTTMPTSASFCDSFSTSTDTGFRRTYTTGTGAYSATTTSSSRTGASGAVKLRVRFGEPVFCPDNLLSATNGNNTYPFNSAARNWRYQWLIKAGELPNKRFKINDISFANGSGLTSFSAAQFQMRMAHTTRTALTTSFDTNLGGCPIEVYNKSLSYESSKGQWAGIDLEKPFGYDGVRNLVVEIRYRKRSSTSSSSFISNRLGTPRIWANSTTADNYAAKTASGSGTTYGLKSMLCIDTSLTAQCTEQVRIGGKGAVYLYGGTPRSGYALSTSFGQGPPIRIQNINLYLVPDNLYYLSLLLGPPLFNNYLGSIGSKGTGTGTFVVAAIPQLVGFCLFHQGVTYTPASGFTGESNVCGTLITK